MTHITPYMSAQSTDKAISEFCTISTQLESVFQLNTRAVDPGQHLYDYIRRTVKTREDYVLHYNTMMGIIPIHHFMSGVYPNDPVEINSYGKWLFACCYLKELDVLAKEKSFHREVVLTKEHYSKLNDFFVNSVTRPWCVSHTTTWLCDLTVIAQLGGLTLMEYLSPLDYSDDCHFAVYIKYAVQQLLGTFSDVICKDPLEEHLCKHRDFLDRLITEFVDSQAVSTELLAYFRTLAANHPQLMVERVE